MSFIENLYLKRAIQQLHEENLGLKQIIMERLLDYDLESPTAVTTPTKLSNQSAPKRSDFPEGEEGSAKFSAASKDWASNTKSNADEVKKQSEAKVDLLNKTETGLKIADAVTDTALSIGALTPPGMAINAAVKGGKALYNTAQGDYVTATAQALDAATPFGKTLQIGKASTALNAFVDPIGQVATSAPKVMGLGTKTADVISKLGGSSLAEPTKKAIGVGVDTATKHGLKSGTNAMLENHMLSFRQFLLEYDVDSSHRRENLPSFEGLGGPSISKNLYNQRDFFLDNLERLHKKGLMSDLGYSRSDPIKDPLKMSSEELMGHLEHAKEHLPDDIHDDLHFAVDTIILHNPTDNLTLQDMGGVRGTNVSPEGYSDERPEYRLYSAGENLRRES